MEVFDYLSFMLLAFLYAFGVLVMVPYTYVNRHKPYSSFLISVGWFAIWNTLFTVLLIAADGTEFETRRIATYSGVATVAMSAIAALHCLAAIRLSGLVRGRLLAPGFLGMDRSDYRRLFPFLCRDD
jgi:hypothetical protein